ncbi:MULTISPECIES: hypothetical protein [unclassified Pseudomonas]|uniref:hypothetical protein n=1 Tax=unclassified Pseudomonas TaxID=196821 RepID=UPI00296EAA5A|nr:MULTISPECIES: hypothetical protein [unclassified Pseudomonas]MDY0832468.1 hypothetical protein [Pseudomonas sp. SED1]
MKVSSENDQHPLLLAAMMQLVANYPAVVWIVGDTWVRCENCEYTIDADESVTREQVRQLLINADWNAEQWLGD